MDIEKEAKELLDNAKKQRGVKAESKEAASESPSEKEKTEGKDIEVQAKRDEEILTKKDEELNPDEKKRKAELVKVADKDKEKSKVQKRIDELTGQVKDLKTVVEEKGKETETERKKRETLETELTTLKKELSMSPEDLFKKKVKGESQKRLQKYLDEDKPLPREERREMVKEELDEWLSEDYEQATDWLTRRSIRRVEEERGFVDSERQNAILGKILSKQRESEKKTFEKHPELNTSERTKALEKEGKKPEEIFKVLCEEVPKYKLCAEILRDNPEKYMLSDTGPELVVAEMEKRLAPPKEDKEKSKVEELETKLNEAIAELNRIKGLDIGITSNRSPEKERETELGKELKELALKVGLSPEKVLQRVKEREAKGYGR